MLMVAGTFDLLRARIAFIKLTPAEALSRCPTLDLTDPNKSGDERFLQNTSRITFISSLSRS